MKYLIEPKEKIQKLSKREKIQFLEDYYSYLNVGFPQKDCFALCANRNNITEKNIEQFNKLLDINKEILKKCVEREKTGIRDLINNNTIKL